MGAVLALGQGMTLVAQPEQTPKLWERRPDESNMAYAAFLAYLKMGPTRSVAKAFFADRAGRGRTPKFVSRHWERWSSQFNWVNRAGAFDASQTETLIDELAERRKRLLDDEMHDYGQELAQWRRALDLAQMLETESVENMEETTDAKSKTKIRTVVIVRQLSLAKLRELALWRDDISRLGRRALGLPEKITENNTTLNPDGEKFGLQIFLPALSDESEVDDV